MIKKVFIILSSLFIMFFSSCKYHSYGLDEFFYRTSSIDNRIKDLKEVKENIPNFINDKPYKILVITDVHFGSEEHNVKKATEEFFSFLDGIPIEDFPLFCICLGDITEHGLQKEFNEYDSFVKKLKNDYGINTFTVIGNHDLYNSGWHFYKEIVFPNTSFYYFKTNQLSYYFIDSASGSLGKNQMNAFLDLLKKDSNPKIVSTHVPIYANGHFYFVMQNTLERNSLISMLAKNNVKAVLVGHTHEWYVSKLGPFTEYNIASFASDKYVGIVSVDPKEAKVECQYVYFGK